MCQPCDLHYKSLMVIYDRDGNGLHYKTMILANLGLDRSKNYDCKI